MSPPWSGNAHPHEIHYHLHMHAVTEPVPHNLEEFLPDTDNFNSKQLKMYYYLCYVMHSDPLYQHASDFMQLVDRNTLAPVLLQNTLLSPSDMEFLQLQTIIESDKVNFIHVKLLRLGKEGFEKFMDCLKDPHAMQHTGHEELYKKLSAPQQQ